MAIFYTMRQRRGLWVLAALALVAGMSFGVLRAQPAEAAGAPKFSAVELADGVLFNTGPVAEHLDQKFQHKVDWTDTLRQVRERVHKAIQKDQDFSASFVEEMQSGDPQAVRHSLVALGDLVINVLVEQYGREEFDTAVVRVIEWIEADGIILDHQLNHQFDYQLDNQLNRELDLKLYFQFDYQLDSQMAYQLDHQLNVVRIMHLITPVVLDMSIDWYKHKDIDFLREMLIGDVAKSLALNPVTGR